MTNIEIAKNNIMLQLQEVINVAERLNMVITIDTKPELPLSMGNYKMVSNVYQKQERHQKLASADQIESVIQSFTNQFNYIVATVIDWKEETIMVMIKCDDVIQIPVGIVSEETWKELENRFEKDYSGNLFTGLESLH